MKYADQGNGNHGEDASLDGIEHAEEGEGFGIPGQSTKGVIGAFRFIADRGNEDGNSTELVAPKRVTRLDVTSEPGTIENEGLSSVSPGSLSPIIGGNTMSTSARIAYIMENGEPFCNHCEKNFIPTTISPRIACSTCGCGRPNDDHNLGDENFDNVEGANAQDLAGNKKIVKQETRLADTDDYVTAFNKIANDSELYYKGYTDAETGKPLDEDLALLSKDYYNGYEQRKFYHQSPQQSEGQKLFDIKPNSNEIPRQGVMTPGEADRGPLELTDGTNRATASKVLGLYEEFKTAGWGQIIKDVASDAANVALHATPNDPQASNYTKRTYMDYDERKAQKEWHDKSAELHSEAANNPNLNEDQKAAHQSAADVHSNLSSQFPKSNIGVFPVHTRDFYDRATAQGIAASQAAGIKNIPSFGATDPRIQKAYNKLKPGINATKISSIFPIDVIQKFFEV